jgi:hypothetical protein
MRQKVKVEASGGNRKSEFEPLFEDITLCEILVSRRLV